MPELFARNSIRNTCVRVSPLVGAMIASALSAAGARGATRIYVGATGGTWSSAGNWSATAGGAGGAGAAPGRGLARITSTASLTVSFDATYASGAGLQSFILDGGSGGGAT